MIRILYYTREENSNGSLSESPKLEDYFQTQFIADRDEPNSVPVSDVFYNDPKAFTMKKYCKSRIPDGMRKVQNGWNAAGLFWCNKFTMRR